MARGSKNRNTTYNSNGTMRVTNVNTSPRLLSPSLPQPLFLLEDRRAYHPDGLYRYPASVPKSAGMQVIGSIPKGGRNARGRKFKGYSPSKSLFNSLATTVGFRKPHRVALCVKRKVRREVLLAFGRGGAGNRKGKRTYTSKFHCG